MRSAVAVREPGARAITWKTVALDFGELLGRALATAVLVGLLLTAAAAAFAAPLPQDILPEQAQSGSFLMRRGGDQPWALAPVLETDVRVRVAGVVARLDVRQSFRNATDEWVEGVYVFPLSEQAAVDHLRMRVGERTIEGQIREREQARVEYRQARERGRKASLVEQERPNVFTTSVANLGPGEVLVVEIELQQTLSFDAGEVRLRLPLAVGPRYIPGAARPASAGTSSGWSPDSDVVPDASRVTPPVLPPDEPRRNPVAIRVDLDPGFPLQSLTSRSHPIVTESRGDGRYRVRLRDAQVPADRDFELVWTPRPGKMPHAAVYSEQKGSSTYVLLTLFPPVGPEVAVARLPREVIYVIDTSGSMEGLSIQQARRALALAIQRLRPGDRFNVIRFGNDTEALFDASRPCDDSTRQAALAWVNALRASGGTEMAGALEAALLGSDDPKSVRQVVFLTDGSVGNEDQLFGIIRQRLGDTRLFTVGIGSAPNAHFMGKAAEFGHGTFTFIGDVSEVEEKMGRLFAVLESPVLTGIEVSWPVAAAVEAWPQRVSDLYLGEPVVVAARLEGRAAGVAVRGRRGAAAWEQILPLDAGRPSDGVAVLWARRKVDSLLDSLHDGAAAEEVRRQVVAVGLEHHLVTKHTSLVAVDVTPTRPAQAALASTAVPTNLPHGWDHAAVFGELPRGSTSLRMDGLLAGVALAVAGLLSLVGRRRRTGLPS
jgi:Ca-activated chloride channel family protein